MRPIAEAKGDVPVLGYFPEQRPGYRFAVIKWSEEHQRWYLAHGGRYIGTPTHFRELLENIE